MHAIWKGTIQVAKFQVPIKLYAATEDKEISLKTTHKTCGGPVTHLKYCQICNSAIETDDIQKVYDLGGGNFVELAEDELKSITPPASKSLIIEQFVDDTDINRMMLKKHYYVGTDEVGEEAYHLFHACLLQSKKIGIGYITLRSVQSLVAVWPLAGSLVISTMLYHEEIRSMDPVIVDQPKLKSRISDNHVAIFAQLIQAMSSPYDGTKYLNQYHVALRFLIENKIAKKLPKDREAEQPLMQRAGNLEDLLSSLQTSLDYVNADPDAFTQSDFNQTH